MTTTWNRLIKLLERWPVDKTKSGRDLGAHFREQFKSVLAGRFETPSPDKNLLKQVTSLERLANNTYLDQYPRQLSSTATGLTGSQCNQVLASEFMDVVNEEK